MKELILVIAISPLRRDWLEMGLKMELEMVLRLTKLDSNRKVELR